MQSSNTAPRAQAPRRSSYNPSLIRRCVRRDVVTADVATFKTKSFTREGVEHHPAVDLQTGECTCTCEHFHYRLQPMVRQLDDVRAISIKTPLLWCKHIERAVANCVRAGEVILDPATKTHSLAHPHAAPVEQIEVPEHVDPETGEVRAGYVQIVTEVPGSGHRRGDWVRESQLDAERAARREKNASNPYAKFFR